MADPLSPADRSALAAEQGPVRMTVGAVLVFEGGPGVQRNAVAARIAERIHLVPRLRQRLVAVPGGLTPPGWADDEEFDLGNHVRRLALSPPGDGAALARLTGVEMARPLDRARPLWELLVVDGLAGGRVALIARIHHALVDGLAAVAIAAVLLDPAPEPTPVEQPADPWHPRPAELRRTLTRMVSAPITRGAELAGEVAERLLEADPRRTAEEAARAAELAAELARSRPQAPRLPLNGRLSESRSYAPASWPLAEAKRVAAAGGGKINDVILAGVTGMLARWLAEAGAALPPGREPVALVPVSVRAQDEAGGNRFSTVLVDLPLSEPDPLARVRILHERVGGLRESAAVRAGALMVGAAGAGPPLLAGVVTRAMGTVRAFNLVVSNVPGPQFPLWMNGARLLALHPAVPLNPAHQRLNVGVLSYDGRLGFGLLADGRLEPGAGVAAAALDAALAELAAAAG